MGGESVFILLDSITDLFFQIYSFFLLWVTHSTFWHSPSLVYLFLFSDTPGVVHIVHKDMCVCFFFLSVTNTIKSICLLF